MNKTFPFVIPATLPVGRQEGIQIHQRIKAKVIINTDEYRQSECFIRNREIWKYRFVENWSLKTIAAYFDITIQEVEEVIEKQRIYFREEYA
jgi:NADH:ubiquinone oxidoreductase subunit E